MNKTLEYYLDLPYTIELIPEPEGGWFVAIKELPGCMSEGDTPEEALEMIEEAKQLWLEVSLEDGDPIPEPRQLDDYSGKFVVRVPRSLHRDLVGTAEEEGVSLNQYINVVLGRAVGRSGPLADTEKEEPMWPGLRKSVKRALLVAGYEEEAGRLDERLFADWANRALSQVDAAVNQRDFHDALDYLEGVAFVLRAAAGTSPVIETLYRSTLLLREQIEMTQRLCEQVGVNEQVLAKLSQFAQSSAIIQMAIQEERAAYSQGSTASAVRTFAEVLVGQEPNRSGW